MITFNCEQCGIETSRTDAMYNRASNHYCSYKCFQESREELKKEYYITFECEICGKERTELKSRYDNKKRHFCSLECLQESNRTGTMVQCAGCGKEVYKEVYRQSRSKRLYCSPECMKNEERPLYNKIRNCVDYINWRKSCFERDEYTCQKCGDEKGGNLVVHHIKHFINIIDGLQNLEQAINYTELWNIDNGVTLCIDCHKLEHKHIK